MAKKKDDYSHTELDKVYASHKKVATGQPLPASDVPRDVPSNGATTEMVYSVTDHLKGLGR